MEEQKRTAAATWAVRMKKWQKWAEEIERFGGKVTLPTRPQQEK